MPDVLFAHTPALAVATMLLAAPTAFLLGARGGRFVALVAASVQMLLAGVMLSTVAREGATTYPIGGWGAPLGIEYRLDGLSATMIALTAVIGLGVTVYAAGYFSDKRRYRYFWPLWLFMWGALVALFAIDDAFNYYVCLELVSIAAIALVAVGGSRPSLVAAMRYLFAAVTGSLFYLFGIGFIYSSVGVLDLSLISEKAAVHPAAQAGLALAVVGLVVKTALVPLHFWLPPAHANAVTPVSAVLSALVVKGSFFILLRLSSALDLGALLPGVPFMLGALGAVAIVWGSLQALGQSRLKMLVAYSTVAQIGYLFIAFPLIYSASTVDQAAIAVTAALFHAVSHGLAKGAMFLAAGAVLVRFDHDMIDGLRGLARRAPAQAAAFAIAGVSMLGLPPSGGFVSKWLYIRTVLETGQWWWALVVLAGGLLAAAYVFRVVGVFMRVPEGDVTVDDVPASLSWAPLVLATLSLVAGVAAQPVLDLLLPAARVLIGGVV